MRVAYGFSMVRIEPVNRWPPTPAEPIECADCGDPLDGDGCDYCRRRREREEAEQREEAIYDRPYTLADLGLSSRDFH